MTPELEQQLQLALEVEAESLKKSLTTLKSSLMIESGGDEVDRMQGAQVRGRAAEEISAKTRQLGEVHAALRKFQVPMDMGDLDLPYGLCEACESPINPKRLIAIPWSRFCLICQNNEEKKRV